MHVCFQPEMAVHASNRRNYVRRRLLPWLLFLPIIFVVGCTKNSAPTEEPKKEPDPPRRHQGPFEREDISIKRAEYTPDGKWIVTLDTMGRISVWDATKDRSAEGEKKPAYTLTTKDEGTPELALLVTKDRVIYPSDNLYCRELRSQKLLWAGEDKEMGAVFHLRATTKGEILAATTDRVTFIDPRTGKTLRRVKLPFHMQRLQTAEDGATLWGVDWRLPRQSEKVHRVDLETGKISFTYEHKEQIGGIYVAADGKRAAFIGGGISHLYDLQTDKLIQSERLSIGSIINADSDLKHFVLVDNRSNKVSIWDMIQQKILAEFTQDQVGVQCAQFSPDGTELMLAGMGINRLGAQYERKEGVPHYFQHAILIFDWRKGMLLRTIAYPWAKPR